MKLDENNLILRNITFGVSQNVYEEWKRRNAYSKAHGC
jgi:hypothetical protein